MKFAAVFTLTTTNLTLIGYYTHYVNSSPLNWKQYRFVSEETKQKRTENVGRDSIAHCYCAYFLSTKSRQRHQSRPRAFVTLVQRNGNEGSENSIWAFCLRMREMNGIFEFGAISFPELRSPWPAVGKRELWEQPLWKNKGNNRILVIRLTAHLHLWRMPEMVAPRARVFRPLVKGNEGLGTRLSSAPFVWTRTRCVGFLNGWSTLRERSCQERLKIITSLHTFLTLWICTLFVGTLDEDILMIKVRT